MLGNFSAAGSLGVALPPPRVAYFARNARPLGASQSCGARECRMRQGAALDATQAQPRRRAPTPHPPAHRSRLSGVPWASSPGALATLLPLCLALPQSPRPIRTRKIRGAGAKGRRGVWRGRSSSSCSPALLGLGAAARARSRITPAGIAPRMAQAASLSAREPGRRRNAAFTATQSNSTTLSCASSLTGKRPVTSKPCALRV